MLDSHLSGRYRQGDGVRVDQVRSQGVDQVHRMWLRVG